MKKTALAALLVFALTACAPNQPGAGLDKAALEKDAKQPKGPAPDFDLENVAGGKLKSAELKGKVLVVDFWATWCEPCIAEIPKFNELHDQYQGKNVQVVGITVESPQADIKPAVEKHKMKYTVLVGNDTVSDGFGGLIGFPTTFIVTKDWKIYKKYMGALPNKQARIRQDIEKLLAQEATTD